MKTQSLLLLIVCLLATQLPAQETAPRPRPARPHIVYFLVDDMGYADAGFMGCQEIQTPHLDRLAQQGAVLESFYVQPVCSPTRSCLMTGRYVAHTGVYSVVRPNAHWGLPLAERTLAAALRDAGYSTAIVGKWHLGEFQPAYRPLHRGFEQQYGNWFGMIDYFSHLRNGQLDWHRNDEPCRDEGYSTHLNAREACRIIKDHQPDRPLFLYVPFNAVHSPFQAPASAVAKYASLQSQRREYAAMVTEMDAAVGQIVDALRAQGLLDNTLILFSSDNGGPSPGRITNNGPLRAGKGTIYEGGIRVCAFAHWPGRIPATRTGEPLHIVDWYPTLLQLAGAPLDQKLPIDGLNIWPVLTERAKTPHDSLLLCGMAPNRVAIRAGDWKLLVGASDQDAETSQLDAAAGSVELYDLSSDLGEKRNLAAAQPERVRELRAQLAAYQKTFVPPGNAGLRD